MEFCHDAMMPNSITDIKTDWENKQSCYVTIKHFQGNTASGDGCPYMGHPNRLAANVWLCLCPRRFVPLFSAYGQNHGVGFIYADSFGNLNDERDLFCTMMSREMTRLRWSNL